MGSARQAARDELRGVGFPMCETVIRRYTARERAHEQGIVVRGAADARAEDAWAGVLGLTAEICG